MKKELRTRYQYLTTHLDEIEDHDERIAVYRFALLQKCSAAENRLAKYVTPLHFRRQHHIEVFGKDYFVDFYQRKHKIAIEVDSPSHDRKDIFYKDMAKDANVRSVGIRILRLTYNDTLDEDFLSRLFLALIKGDWLEICKFDKRNRITVFRKLYTEYTRAQQI